jgi:AcrR family transcriptional regulator
LSEGTAQPEPSSAGLGLRERKKVRTRASIRQHAMRLFREHGYEATTVEQIAAAAEVSPSTFFRYFPTKEDVVLADDLDPPMIAAFRAQPADLNPVAALRNAMRCVLDRLPPEAWAQERERITLIRSVPELRARTLEGIATEFQLAAGIVAERVGRRPEDFEVRVFTGALLGIVLATWFTWSEESGIDYFTVLDAALAHLEAGLPL